MGSFAATFGFLRPDATASTTWTSVRVPRTSPIAGSLLRVSPIHLFLCPCLCDFPQQLVESRESWRLARLVAHFRGWSPVLKSRNDAVALPSNARPPVGSNCPRKQRWTTTTAAQVAASRIRLSAERSWVIARRMAIDMSGPVSFEKPTGLPWLRSVIWVASSPIADHV